jgi:hypothetical protein
MNGPRTMLPVEYMNRKTCTLFDNGSVARTSQTHIMKAVYGILVLSGAIASAAASAIGRRQLTGLYGAPVSKALNVKTLKPEVRPNAKRQVARYGPFNLPALKNVILQIFPSI